LRPQRTEALKRSPKRMALPHRGRPFNGPAPVKAGICGSPETAVCAPPRRWESGRGSDDLAQAAVQALHRVGNRYEGGRRRSAGRIERFWRIVRPSGTEAPGARSAGRPMYWMSRELGLVAGRLCDSPRLRNAADTVRTLAEPRRRARNPTTAKSDADLLGGFAIELVNFRSGASMLRTPRWRGDFLYPWW
jgi:hypothetical protein